MFASDLTNDMKRLVTIFLLLMFSISLSGEVVFAKMNSQHLYKRDSVKILFKVADSMLDSTYRSNGTQLAFLDSILTFKINEIDSIYISSKSSIEGSEIFNMHLSYNRSKSLANYIKTNYSNLSKVVCIDLDSIGEDWNGLYQYIYNNDNVPYRKDLLAIFNDKRLDNSQKKARIRAINTGKLNSFMIDSMYSNSRNATAIILVKNKKVEPRNLIPLTNVNTPLNNIYISRDKIERIDIKGSKGRDRVVKPLFALKTNLLFDLATLLNFEIEVPIKKRFSIAGEFIFPFWKSNSADLTIGMLNANVDIKYWFGNRDNKEVMTGWNAGVYGGYGKFDYQLFSKNGVQGDFFNVGIGAGYAHSIAKNLRLEYSLGLGLIRSDYYKYKMVKGTNYGDIKVVSSPWNKFYNNFLGPTKAKISLVWLINYSSSK